jgi:hypothetical protein
MCVDRSFLSPGTPTSASTVSCLGADGNAQMVRNAETVTCTVTADVASLASDFTSATLVGGTSLSGAPTGTNGGTAFTFTFTSPAVGVTTSVTGRLAAPTDFSEGAVAITVIGM